MIVCPHVGIQPTCLWSPAPAGDSSRLICDSLLGEAPLLPASRRRVSLSMIVCPHVGIQPTCLWPPGPPGDSSRLNWSPAPPGDSSRLNCAPVATGLPGCEALQPHNPFGAARRGPAGGFPFAAAHKALLHLAPRVHPAPELRLYLRRVRPGAYLFKQRRAFQRTNA